MEILSLCGQLSHSCYDLIGLDRISWKQQIDLFTLSRLFDASPLVQRRDALQAPFFIGDPLLNSIAPGDQRFLPPFFGFLPLRPCLSNLQRHSVCVGKLVGDLLCEGLAVYECSSRRDWQEEEAHGNDIRRDRAGSGGSGGELTTTAASREKKKAEKSGRDSVRLLRSSLRIQSGRLTRSFSSSPDVERPKLAAVWCSDVIRSRGQKDDRKRKHQPPVSRQSSFRSIWGPFRPSRSTRFLFFSDFLSLLCRLRPASILF